MKGFGTKLLAYDVFQNKELIEKIGIEYTSLGSYFFIFFIFYFLSFFYFFIFLFRRNFFKE